MVVRLMKNIMTDVKHYGADVQCYFMFSPPAVIYDLVIICREQVTCKHKMIYSNLHWTVDRSTAQSCMYLERTALFVCCIFHVWLVTVTLDMHCTIGTVTWKQDCFSWSVEFYWEKHHLMSMEPLNVCSDETSFSRWLHCDSLVTVV